MKYHTCHWKASDTATPVDILVGKAWSWCQQHREFELRMLCTPLRFVVTAISVSRNIVYFDFEQAFGRWFYSIVYLWVLHSCFIFAHTARLLHSVSFRGSLASVSRQWFSCPPNTCPRHRETTGLSSLPIFEAKLVECHYRSANSSCLGGTQLTSLKLKLILPNQ